MHSNRNQRPMDLGHGKKGGLEGDYSLKLGISKDIWQKTLMDHFSGHSFLLPWACPFFMTSYIVSIVRLSSKMEDSSSGYEGLY